MTKKLPYPKSPLSINLPLDYIEGLDRLSEPHEITRSTLIRRAIREFLERQFPTETQSATPGLNGSDALV